MVRLMAQSNFPAWDLDFLAVSTLIVGTLVGTCWHFVITYLKNRGGHVIKKRHGWLLVVGHCDSIANMSSDQNLHEKTL